MAIVIVTLCVVSPGTSGVPVFKGDHILIPLYADGRREPEVLVRIDEMRRGFERRSFFRIGVLPILQIRNASIEFQNTENPRVMLASIERCLRAFGGQTPVNLQEVAFRFPGEAEPRLQAEAVTLGPEDCWKLSGHLRFVFADNRICAQTALLKVTGAEAGRLEIQLRDQVLTTDLFDPSLERIPQQSTPDTP